MLFRVRFHLFENGVTFWKKPIEIFLDILLYVSAAQIFA
jgi:hypothetical protein